MFREHGGNVPGTRSQSVLFRDHAYIEHGPEQERPPSLRGEGISSLGEVLEELVLVLDRETLQAWARADDPAEGVDSPVAGEAGEGSRRVDNAFGTGKAEAAPKPAPSSVQQPALGILGSICYSMARRRRSCLCLLLWSNLSRVSKLDTWWRRRPFVTVLSIALLGIMGASAVLFALFSRALARRLRQGEHVGVAEPCWNCGAQVIRRAVPLACPLCGTVFKSARDQ